MAEPYQSLYRRYRPQRFDEVRGQDHVTRALRNSVRDDTVHHAYLFSGPRGTGKTSTARILAKALNCTDVRDGEPCGLCESCQAVVRGTSLDVHELDAASNNGVDAMRDLVARAALGTPGRWKVYIVDEVHMLSAAASNALLKTLEEPPGHVVFVLATTDPQKVLPTIRSRTQHFEFRLLRGEVLSTLLHDVSADAGLGVPAEAIDLAVRRGHGSARDALSVLDQVAAAGTVEDDAAPLDQLVEAMVERDTGMALTAVAEAHAAGRDTQRLATDLLEHLRNGFLATMAPDLVALPDAVRHRLAEQAHRLGVPALVRALETIGQAQVAMRDALDARVCLEAALVRLTRPEADASPEALLERIDRLERRLAGAGLLGGGGGGPAGGGREAVSGGAGPTGSRTGDPTAPADHPGARGGSRPAGTPGPGAARVALGALKQQRGSARGAGPVTSAPSAGAPRQEPRPSPPAGRSATEPPATTGAPTTGAGRFPSRDDLTKAWGDELLARLKGRARARFMVGRWLEADDGHAVYAVPNEPHRRYAEEFRPEVEGVLSSHFGVRVPLRLVVDPDAGDAGAAVDPGASVANEPDDEDFNTSGLPEAPVGADTPEDRLQQAFPGASWEVRE